MAPGPLPPEWHLLLLACAVPTPETRRQLRAALDPQSLDWGRILHSASEHDLGPRVYDGLRRHGVLDEVAAPARARLQEQYFATAIRNTLLHRELTHLLDALRSHGTRVMLLKGAALVTTIPGTAALRPMRDIDLLVPDADVPAVEQLFEASGYALAPEYQARRQWYRTRHYHLAFQKPSPAGPAIRCEVHWQLERASRPFAIDTDGLWTRSQPVTVGHAAARVLCAEDLLLHLCLHACKHRLTGGFRAFCDMADVIRAFGGHIDWPQVHARAVRWQIAGFVYVPLWLAQQLLGAPVPSRFMRALRPDTIDDEILAAAAGEAMNDRVDAALFPEFVALRHGRSLRHGARTLKTVLDPATVASRYDLSPRSKRVYWYYPRRLMDVAVAYGPRLWQFSRRPHEVTARVAARSRLAEWLAPFSDEQSV